MIILIHFSEVLKEDIIKRNKIMADFKQTFLFVSILVVSTVNTTVGIYWTA